MCAVKPPVHGAVQQLCTACLTVLSGPGQRLHALRGFAVLLCFEVEVELQYVSGVLLCDLTFNGTLCFSTFNLLLMRLMLQTVDIMLNLNILIP